MAYTPVGWQTGDTITADRLNKMDNGWSVSQATQQLFSGSVTTEDYDGEAWGTLPYNGTITADSLAVTFDGVLYDCPRQDNTAFGAVYGGWDGSGADFSEIPFIILASSNEIMTADVGTFAISATATVNLVETSASFKAAVSSVSTAGVMIVEQNKTTWQQVHDAIVAGRIPIFVYEENDSSVYLYKADHAVYDVDTDGNYRVYFNGGNFTMIATSADSALFSE